MMLRALSALASVSLLSLAACATSVVNPGSTGAGGADGGAGGEAQGGGGEAPGGGGAGGGGSACEQDCSAVQTPPCFASVCNEATGLCEVVAAGVETSCDDGLFCTVNDHCDGAGECVGGGENDCGQTTDTCKEITCDEASDSCTQVNLPNDFPCATGDLCDISAKCQNGLCVGTPKDCFFSPVVMDECHVGVCNPANGQCEAVPGNDGAPCPNDGDLCMVDKTCAAGVCGGGTPKDCSFLTAGCTNGVCEPATGDCYADPIAPGGTCIEATDECNTGICSVNGTCDPVPTPGVLCASATDACNQGSCDANGQCVPSPVNDGGACNDGNSCTAGETCSAGACTGGSMAGYEVYFQETFASNVQGWSFVPIAGNEWQIGPAVASPATGSCGNGDPGTDHTSTADNGIAGVTIGGNAVQTLHGYHFIESPAFDTSGAQGAVYLEFWRWLNSDYPSFMTNKVEVWDGAAWQVVWQQPNGSGVISDAAWTPFSYDITAFKNAQMKVRFGFEIGSSGVYLCSSWNLDDVVVANLSCQM